MISRRGFVRMAGGSALLGSTGLQLMLEACGAPAPPAATSPTSAPGAAGVSVKNKNQVVMPTYIPAKLPTAPDYHSSDPRITDAYDLFPRNPFKSWNKPAPGGGGKVDVFIVAYYPEPTLYENNPTWQEIN